ncbi:MAG: MATE family efflux transporter [Myxococcota bacterium]
MNTAAPLSQTAIAKRLFQLSWPIIGLNVLQVLALAVDTAMIGRTPAAEAALTGMGYASQLIFLLMVAMIGLTVGTVALIARAHGVDDHERVEHVLNQSIQLTVLLGLGVAVVGNLLGVPLMWALGASGEAMDAGLSYLRPLLLGTAFSYLNILFAAGLRGVGNTRAAFAVALVMNGLNLVFNYGLILGNFGLPALGIQGAAIGTVMAQGSAVVLMVLWLRRGGTQGLVPRLRPRAIDGELARTLLRIGWPASLDILVLNASFLTIIGLLSAIDPVAVAAHGIGLRVQALAFVPGMSISQAVGAMAGNALGGGRVQEARRVMWAGLVLCLGVMTPLGALLIGFDDWIVTLFGVEQGTPMHGYTVQWMQLLGYSMPVVAVYIAFAGLLQGAGDTRASLRINAVTTLLGQIPLSFILGFGVGLGTWGVWAAFPVAFGFKMVWGYLEYRRGRWARTGATV